MGGSSRILQGYGFLFWRNDGTKNDSRQTASGAAGGVSDRAGARRAGVSVRGPDARAGPRSVCRVTGRGHWAAEAGRFVVDAAAAGFAGGAHRRGAFRLRLRVSEYVRKPARDARYARRCLGGKLRRGAGAASGLRIYRRTADGVFLRCAGRGADVPDGKGRVACVDDLIGHHDGLPFFGPRFACQIHRGHRVAASGHHLLAHGKPERGQLRVVKTRRSRNYCRLCRAAAFAVEAQSASAL